MNPRYRAPSPFTGPIGRFARVRRAHAVEAQDAAFEELIRSIPPGKVATYGQVADAAGYPRYHRQVARFLRSLHLNDIPWQRVIGAGGEIKTRGDAAAVQRSLLKAEGVKFIGKRVDMELHQHVFLL